MKSHNNISAHIDSSTTPNNLLDSSLGLRDHLADQSNRVAGTAQMNTQMIHIHLHKQITIMHHI